MAAEFYVGRHARINEAAKLKLFGWLRRRRRILTRARSEALAAIDDWAPRILTRSERTWFRDSIGQNLTSPYDAGERDPKALNLAALRSIRLAA